MVRDSLGVGIAVGAYGVAFGAASVAAGFTPAQTSVSSLLTFTGGTQFAIAGVIAGGGTAAAALSGGYLLGARNTLYALRMRPMLGVRGWRVLLAALFTIDESTAMALGQRRASLSRVAFWWTAASVYLFWNLATVLGAVGAQALGNPERFGLDAAIPAAFLALLAPRLRRAAADSPGAGAVGVSRRVALAGALIALALIPLTPPGIPVLAACAGLAFAADVGTVRRLGRPGRRR
ncbi:AzlC family ABC transporter permease [Jatrophihabitans telluris]|uniref:AzlC family ABC transporter permease n=1 Tax=Jatrophihabitans telluris TaxID=2038343 RepID=A0ABY4QVM9_9ACTN|nr:AzlC family ABC transporter permease [Jatrophihabitans telluris]UQX87679.1 AzlC family ABC transporter permease [Jatrophihabitans telluris]